MADFYVKLINSQGGDLIHVANVEAYTFENQTVYVQELYRDLDFEIPATSTTSTGVPADGASVIASPTKKYRVPDNIEHIAPRQATMIRHYHKFVDANGAILRFWDDFVVGVTNAQK